MKIVEVTDYHIRFDNGSEISYAYEPECYEENYADFKQIEEAALNFDFPEDLDFEAVDGYGFRFGAGTHMFFVPCYSAQNGAYSTIVGISYNGKNVLYPKGKEIEE